MTNSDDIGSMLINRLKGSDILKNKNALQVLICIATNITKVNKEITTDGRTIMVKAGCAMVSISAYATKLDIGRSTIDRYLKLYRSEGLLNYMDHGRSGTLVDFNVLIKDQAEVVSKSGDVGRLNGQVVKAGNAVIPGVAVDVEQDDGQVKRASAHAIIVSSLTSYEVRKDNITHACEGRHETQVAGKAACEGGNKVAQGQGPLLCTGSPTQPSVQGAPVSSGVRPVASPTPSPSPASPKLGVAQRLKLDRQQEREREAQRTAGIVVSSGRDRACAAKPEPTMTLAVVPGGKKRKGAKKAPPRFTPESIEYILAKQLIDLILSEIPDSRTTNLVSPAQWAYGMYALINDDGRDPAEIAAIMDYISTNDRWSIRAILSPKKLQSQYDRLAISYRKRKGAAKSRTQDDRATPKAVIAQREDSMSRLARLQAEHAEKCGGVVAPRPGAEFGF